MSIRVSARSWEKAPLWCRLFGHVWEDGWYGDVPYGKIHLGSQDGVGRKHGYLTFECDRCGREVTFARLHTNDPKLASENALNVPA